MKRMHTARAIEVVKEQENRGLNFTMEIVGKPIDRNLETMT